MSRVVDVQRDVTSVTGKLTGTLMYELAWPPRGIVIGVSGDG